MSYQFLATECITNKLSVYINRYKYPFFKKVQKMLFQAILLTLVLSSLSIVSCAESTTLHRRGFPAPRRVITPGEKEKALKAFEENARKEFENAGFHLEQRLGKGAFGAVFKATDSSGHAVAIKVPLSRNGLVLYEKEVLEVLSLLFNARNSKECIMS
jgi:hypothetical protein